MHSLPNSALKREFLFCPGPTNTAANVRHRGGSIEIGHREPAFEELFRHTTDQLLDLYQIHQKSDYQAVLITGSGTAANEALLASAVGHRTILILTNGEFGDRLANLSRLHNPNTTVLEFGWAQPLDVDRIRTYLDQHPTDLLMMVHHETSSGLLNPIEAIGGLAAERNIQFLVDTVSSAGADLIDMEACHIAFATGSAGKALGGFPGLSYVVGRRDAFEALSSIPMKIAYLNLATFYHYATHKSQTPNTPAVQSIAAFDAALENLLTEGVVEAHLRIQARAETTRAELDQMGFAPLIDSTLDRSVVLTTVFPPDHKTVAEIQGELRRRGIVTYGGKGVFEGHVLQIGHIGTHSEQDHQFLIRSLQEVVAAPMRTRTPRQSLGNRRVVHQSHITHA